MNRDVNRTAEPAAARWKPLSNQRIRDLPHVDRPREKLITKGAQALTDVELLAVLLGSGTRRASVFELASTILETFDGRLDRVDAESLLSIQGVGRAKTCQIAAAFELARRHYHPDDSTVREAKDVLPYLRTIRSKRQEHFACVSLDGANSVIASRIVSIGSLNASHIHPREVFADPIADRAAAVILAHNHPSGTLEASSEDIAITRRLKQAGELLGIRVLDHLIVTDSGYFSMQQRDLL